MIDDIARARDEALAAVRAATTLERLSEVTSEALGKRGPLSTLKAKLGSLPTVEEKKAMGQAMNDAFAAVGAAADARRADLAAAERAAQLAAERLDLTERRHSPSRGHAHLVTQSWQRLEDVFVGLGFRVAEGPEVETDWYNFEALNMPP